MPKCRLRPAGTVREKVTGPVECQPRLARGTKVRRAAHQPRHVLADGVEHLAGSVPRRDALRVRREPGQLLVPALRQLPVLHAIELIGQLRIFRPVLLDARKPGVAQVLAALADPVPEMLVYALGNVEAGILRPAVGALGQTDFLLAERLTMGGAGVLLVRRTVRDVAIHDDQRRPVVACSGTCGRPAPASPGRWRRQRASRSSRGR